MFRLERRPLRTLRGVRGDEHPDGIRRVLRRAHRLSGPCARHQHSNSKHDIAWREKENVASNETARSANRRFSVDAVTFQFFGRFGDLSIFGRVGDLPVVGSSGDLSVTLTSLVFPGKSWRLCVVSGGC